MQAKMLQERLKFFEGFINVFSTLREYQFQVLKLSAYSILLI